MESQFLANLLGVVSETFAMRTSSSAAQSTQSFGEALATALGSSVSPTASSTIGDIVFSLGAGNSDMIAQMNSASTLEERLELAGQFRDQVVDSLNAAGYTASAGGDVDQVVVGGVTYDILRSIHTLGAQTNVQLHRVTGESGSGSYSGTANGSVSEIVYANGREHADLIAKINSATTQEGRVEWANAFRDEVIADLKAAGYDVIAIGDADKIAVDGSIYDILSNVKSVGTNTTVQMHYVSGAEGGSSSNPLLAIMAAASEAVDLLAQINSSSDVGERNEIAEQAQELIVAALNAAGFSASAGDEADKLVVNGKTYDFISSLNSPGSTARFQALLVG